VATITRLKSGSWRVQVRRKGKYVNETFLRRKNAEEWGIDIERRIDRQEPTTTRKSRDVQLFGDLVALHRQDLEEVGKDIGRSKTANNGRSVGAAFRRQCSDLKIDELVTGHKDRKMLRRYTHLKPEA
jgi:hypothetical protein